MVSRIVGFYTKDEKVRPITAPRRRPARATGKHTQLDLDQFRGARVTIGGGGMVIDQSKKLGVAVGKDVETGEKVAVPIAVRKQITVHPPSWDDAVRYTKWWSITEEDRLDRALERLETAKLRLDEAAKLRQVLRDSGQPVLQADQLMSAIENEMFQERAKIYGPDLRGYNRWVVRDRGLANRLAEEVAASHGGAEIVPLPDLAKRDGSIWGYLVWTKGYWGYMGG